MKTSNFVAGFILSALMAGTALSADQIGQVISVEGIAKVHGDDQRAESLALKSQIFLNDRIVTEADSKVQIMLADDTVVMVGENAEMILDAYVYSPDVAAENESSMSLIKGAFRVMTAKITDLNPKKFHVKSKWATIGIRGCELGFNITEDNEEIQIIRVPENKEIVVASSLGNQKALHVFQQGVLVNVDTVNGLTQRPLTSADILRINKATTPPASAVRNGVAQGGSAPAANSTVSKIAARREAAAGDEVAGGVDLADSDVAVEDSQADAPVLATAQTAVDELADATVNRETMVAPVVDVVAVETTVESVMEAKTDDVEATVNEDVVEVASVDTASREPVSEPPPVVDPPTTPVDPVDPVDPVEPEPTYPIVGTQVNTPQGGGADWSWGTWARDDITGVDSTGADVTRTVDGADVAGSQLSAAEFATLNDPAASLKVLTGTGIAAAGVTQGDQSALLTGSSDVQVIVGGNVTPRWNGDFTLGNAAGDSLAFDAAGTVTGPRGGVATSAGTYALDAFGATHDRGSLTVNEVNSVPVGNAGQITGNIGTFDFEHGDTGPKVQGVFGADVAE